MTGGHVSVESAGPTAIEIEALSAEQTRGLGARLATVLKAGDVVVLSGELGAGKTTFTQGIGSRLGIRGDVTSPTFVISRVHPSLVGGPALVHVDAYRLRDVAELDDLDLDETLDDAVTVVEWGDGLADALSESRLHVHLAWAPRGSPTDWADPTGNGGDDEPRTIRVEAVGPRWVGVELGKTLAAHVRS